MKKPSLTFQIFIALILGVAVGLLMQHCSGVAVKYIKPFGVIFLNLIKFIVVPLVMLSIICGIISMKDISKLGKLGGKTLLYFFSTTVIAATMGLVVSTLFKNVFPIIDLPAVDLAGKEPPHLDVMQQIVDIFPGNFIDPMFTMNMMQVIVIAVFIGLAIVLVGEKARLAADVLVSFNEIVTRILGMILAVAPIGVFCLLCPVVAVNGPSVLGSLAVLIGIAYFCFFIHAVVVYGGSVRLLGRMNPWKFFKGEFPAMLFAFSSDSSVATLPVNMKCTQKMGVPKSIGDFVLSLGATINMDGVAIYLGVTSVFIAHCYGIDLTMGQYVAIALSSTIASIGTPGIPGGSLALMAAVFASAGIPMEGVAVVAGIDRIIDMGRTMMSVTGDAACSVVVSKKEREEMKKEE